MDLTIEELVKEDLNIEEDDSVMKTYVALDVGSTAVRTKVFGEERMPGSFSYVDSKVLEIDSKFAETDTDISHIKSQSSMLSDNMEIALTDESFDKENLVENTTVIKGGLLKDVQNLSLKNISSSMGKVEQDSAIKNIISNIGLVLFTHYKGSLTDTVVDLTLSLPTMDVDNNILLEKFLDTIAGRYKFELPRYGFECSFTLNREEITIEDESRAALRYWATKNRTDSAKFPRVLVVDGGGRSFDIGYLEEGRLNRNGCATLQFGGNQLEEYVANNVVKSLGIPTPNTRMVRESLTDALLQDGMKEIDISAEIGESKALIAKEVVEGLVKLFDSAGINGREISMILCTGGCFNVSKREGEVVVPSLHHFIKKEFEQVSQNTGVTKMKGKHPIVEGLVFYRLSTLEV